MKTINNIVINSSNSFPKNYENLPSGPFYDLFLSNNSVLIDVRSFGEYVVGKIPGAINIDVSRSDFKIQVEELPKEKIYLVYCRSGNRSKTACEIMINLGFENVKNLEKGLISWRFGIV
ncbi:rhodanese-like domain-containing protein [Algoriphagus sp.]|uniref:rhodanese-like domain-containing protein n=1 Tax=Algoriphagus sp. TaxID=1872435 RepID=UPI0025D5999E|nr:rhodanese-like domain-containing protein [Algoriphagus sp.]